MSWAELKLSHQDYCVHDNHDEEGKKERKKDKNDAIRSRGVEVTERQTKRGIHNETHMGNQPGASSHSFSGFILDLSCSAHMIHSAYSRSTKHVTANDHRELKLTMVPLRSSPLVHPLVYLAAKRY
jgi:hypothetical protein